MEWVGKQEEMELDLSKGEVYSAVFFSIHFREDEIRSSFPTEPAFLIGEKKRGTGYFFWEEEDCFWGQVLPS